MSCQFGGHPPQGLNEAGGLRGRRLRALRRHLRQAAIVAGLAQVHQEIVVAPQGSVEQSGLNKVSVQGCANGRVFRKRPATQREECGKSVKRGLVPKQAYCPEREIGQGA